MGYDVTITRKTVDLDGDYYDRSNFQTEKNITLNEFEKLLAEDNEMKIEIINGAECLVWTNFPEWKKEFGNFPFEIRNGEITIKNPSGILLDQMIYISKYVNARVEGDDRETYDWNDDGDIITIPATDENDDEEYEEDYKQLPKKSETKKWWKFW